MAGKTFYRRGETQVDGDCELREGGSAAGDEMG